MIIYKLTNNTNGKIYIGKTERKLQLRRAEYIRSMKYPHYPISHALVKYGWDGFTFEAIDETAKSSQHLEYLEIYYIAQFDSNDPNKGYNLTVGGEGCNGYRHTEEFKQRMRKPKSLETKKNMSIAATGKKYPNRKLVVMTPETKKRVSEGVKRYLQKKREGYEQRS